MESCIPIIGYVDNTDDCDDLEASAFTGATGCDGVDNDCNGQTDEGVLLSWYLDRWRWLWNSKWVDRACVSQASTYVNLDGDCDDFDTSYNRAYLLGVMIMIIIAMES